MFHPISEETRRRLVAGGVDPDQVGAIARLAVSEDLDGGVDVTTAATVPAEQRSVGTFGARRAGTIAGLAVAAAGVETVCGAEASDYDFLVDHGARVSPGTDV